MYDVGYDPFFMDCFFKQSSSNWCNRDSSDFVCSFSTFCFWNRYEVSPFVLSWKNATFKGKIPYVKIERGYDVPEIFENKERNVARSLGSSFALTHNADNV